jgi:putative ABC transport system ATP-binding protein
VARGIDAHRDHLARGGGRVTVDGAARSPIISVRDARREFRLGSEPVQALRGVSLEIADSDYVAIVGPSGCGKSTLLNLLGAIDRPTTGTVTIRGRDVSTMSDREATDFRLRNIGFVFQRFYLMQTLSALENVVLPMAEAGVAKREREARARELLAYVGIAARERHRPAQLSGGEQQRVAIARALANRPALLLADEPTGELDARTGAEIIALFGRLNADGTTIVVVTHDEQLASAAKRIVRMRDGLIVDGAADSVVGAEPDLRTAAPGGAPHSPR